MKSLPRKKVEMRIQKKQDKIRVSPIFDKEIKKRKSWSNSIFCVNAIVIIIIRHSCDYILVKTAYS